MRRTLNREETYIALHWFYIDGKDLGTIAKDLNCTVYDLSPWITEVGTRIILGLPERKPELHTIAKLLSRLDDAIALRPLYVATNRELFIESAKTIRSLTIDNEIYQNFLHISDIRYREATELLERITKAEIYNDADSDEELAISYDLRTAIEDANAFLADDTPTDTEDDTYTEGVAADGAAILKDGVPLTITQILDILNGRTRR